MWYIWENKRKNVKTGRRRLFGSYNEDFNNTDKDIETYIDFTEKHIYKNIYLKGHSLGVNKIIYFLSRNHDKRIKKYILLNQANVKHLLNGVALEEKKIIKNYKKEGKDNEIIPFELFGWIECINKVLMRSIIIY